MRLRSTRSTSCTATIIRWKTMTMISFDSPEQMLNTVVRTKWDGKEYMFKCFKDGEYRLVDIALYQELAKALHDLDMSTLQEIRGK